MMAVEITKPHLLIVEGKEDELFFEALMKRQSLQDIQIMAIGGKVKLRENLKALVLSPSFAKVISLAVVRDANADPDAAFQSVRDALRAAHLPVPEDPLVPIGHNPRVSIMILPREGTPGMLEDLCLEAVASDPAMLCVEQYLQCLEHRGLSLTRNRSKAKMQAFLASRLEAGKRLGEAAQANYWPWGAAAFDQVKNFLQQFAFAGNSA